jgi:hypothetical protein
MCDKSNIIFVNIAENNTIKTNNLVAILEIQTF